MNVVEQIRTVMDRLDHPTLSSYVSLLEVVAEKRDWLPPEPDLALFDDYIEDLRDSASDRGDLDRLRVSLADALRSDDDIRKLAATHYAWLEPQLRRIIAYAYARLFPEHPL